MVLVCWSISPEASRPYLPETRPSSPGDFERLRERSGRAVPKIKPPEALPVAMAAGANDPAAVARRLLGDGIGLKRDQSVIIETWNHTLPYATACVVEARRIGARPLLLLEDEAAYWRSVDVAPAIARWAKVGAPEWAALAKTDGYVFFPGPSDM